MIIYLSSSRFVLCSKNKRRMFVLVDVLPPCSSLLVIQLALNDVQTGKTAYSVVKSKVSRDVFHLYGLSSRGTCHFALGEAGSPGVAHNHFHPSGRPGPRQKHSRLLAPFRMGGLSRQQQLGRAEIGRRFTPTRSEGRVVCS